MLAAAPGNPAWSVFYPSDPSHPVPTSPAALALPAFEPAPSRKSCGHQRPPVRSMHTVRFCLTHPIARRAGIPPKPCCTHAVSPAQDRQQSCILLLELHHKKMLHCNLMAGNGSPLRTSSLSRKTPARNGSAGSWRSHRSSVMNEQITRITLSCTSLLGAGTGSMVERTAPPELPCKDGDPCV